MGMVVSCLLHNEHHSENPFLPNSRTLSAMLTFSKLALLANKHRKQHLFQREPSRHEPQDKRSCPTQLHRCKRFLLIRSLKNRIEVQIMQYPYTKNNNNFFNENNLFDNQLLTTIFTFFSKKM